MVPVKCVPVQDTSFILGPSLNIPNNVKKAGVHYLQTFLGIHTFTKLVFSFWHQIQISIVSIMPASTQFKNFISTFHGFSTSSKLLGTRSRLIMLIIDSIGFFLMLTISVQLCMQCNTTTSNHNQ